MWWFSQQRCVFKAVPEEQKNHDWLLPVYCDFTDMMYHRWWSSQILHNNTFFYPEIAELFAHKVFQRAVIPSFSLLWEKQNQ